MPVKVTVKRYGRDSFLVDVEGYGTFVVPQLKVDGHDMLIPSLDETAFIDACMVFVAPEKNAEVLTCCYLCSEQNKREKTWKGKRKT